ncbi:MAG: O-antigen ligase family protein [Zoogloeaceae bacterium]|nr:O-antigen ligase family protein [Gammaproteobacteria bacterium]MCP5230840.1 O-antigen ligase family protein [Zoogloeaceae bacterium]
MYSNSVRQALPLVPPAILLFALTLTGTIALRLLMLLIAVGIAAYTWRTQGGQKPPCLAAWAIWTLVAAFSLIGAADLAYSLREMKSEIGYSLLIFLVFFVLTRDRARLELWAGTLLVAFWVISIAGTLASENGKWVSGRWGGVGDYSTILVELMPLLGLLYFTTRERSRGRVTRLVDVLALATVALALGTAYLSNNRMVWITFAVMAIGFFIFITRKLSTTLVLVGGLTITLAFGAVLATAAAKGLLSAWTVDDVGELFAQDERIVHWTNVVPKILDNPIQGSGFGRASMYKAYPELRVFGSLWHAHNLALDVAVQMGIPGVIALILLLGCPARHLWRLLSNPDPLLRAVGITGLLLIVAVLTKNMTDDFFARHHAMLFWAQIGMLLGLASHRQARAGAT